MVKIYADLIRNHKINPKTNKEYCLKDVPLAIRDKVEKELDAN